MNNVTGPTGSNMQKIVCDIYTPKEAAGFCNTTVVEIEQLIEELPQGQEQNINTALELNAETKRKLDVL